MGAPKIAAKRRKTFLVLRSIWSYLANFETRAVPHSGQRV
jgi:hypothetical protein